MRVTLCSLWMMALSLLHWAAATSDFCYRPANMDLCWWRNNLYKRYLRFGRGDPFLRFGRSKLESWRFNPFARLGKRDADSSSSDDLESYLENNGYLRFGRSAFPPPILALLSIPAENGNRKKRDVTSALTPEVSRTTRDIKDGGFLRFGRNNIDNAAAAAATGKVSAAPSAPAGGVPEKKATHPINVNLRGDSYLRFGRDHFGDFTGFGKRNYLRFGRTSPEGYLRFGKRSAEMA